MKQFFSVTVALLFVFTTAVLANAQNCEESCLVGLFGCISNCDITDDLCYDACDIFYSVCMNMCAGGGGGS